MTPRILVLLLLITSSVSAQPLAEKSATSAAKADAVAEIAKLQEAYNTAMEANATEGLKWNEGLEKWYLDGLDKLKAERSKAGDLDGAVLAKTEHDRIAAHTETTAEQIKAMSPAMRALRTRYEGSLRKIAEEVGKRNLPVSQKFLADLEALQKRITVSGDIEQALIVKAEKDRFAAQLAASAPKPTAIPAAIAAPTPSAKPKVVQAAKEAPVTTIEGLTKHLIGTKWIWFDRETITFLADGKAQWKENPDHWPWKVTSVGRRVIEGENIRKGNKFTMTLDRDLKTGTIAEVNGGGPRKTRDVTKE